MALVALSACQVQPQPCVDPSKGELDQCRLELDKVQTDVNSVKLKLAQCAAHPDTVQVDELAITGKVDLSPPKEGTLTQEQVVATIRRGKAQLKACYERAMKKSARLQTSKITITFAFKVRPSGVPAGISIRPSYDRTMTDCMMKAIRRWKFPSFTGQPVDVESPLTLSPKR